MPFCFFNSKFLNPNYNYRKENVIIFTSEIQLKKLEKANQIFIDSTFKCCPKNYYQLFNIVINIGEGRFIFPIMHVLMTHKSAYSYKVIFKYLNELIETMKINFNFNEAHIMTDFEHSLRKVIKDIYPKCYLEGCYFHYSKALWNKSKKLGLLNKKYIKILRFIIFGYKMYPFLKEVDKKKFLGGINKYIEEYGDNKKLKKLSKYFKRNWENSNFIEFESINDSRIKYRTNNQIELFHRSLNQLIENSHPKISYLLAKLKLIIVNKYNEYLIYDNKINNDKICKYDLFKDVYNFAIKFSQKYDVNFDFKILLQTENKDELIKICDNILEEIFDVTFSQNENEKEEENDEKSEEESEKEELDNLTKSENFDNLDAKEDEKEDAQSEGKNDKSENEEDKSFYINEEIPRKRKNYTYNIIEKIYNKNSKKK